MLTGNEHCQLPQECNIMRSDIFGGRTRFYWDLAAWLPLDYLALWLLGDFHAGQSIIARVPLLRLLRMVRRAAPCIFFCNICL